MQKKINLGDNAKVNIKWSVLPIDYSHEKENSIITKFAKKYGISKDNVRVTPVFIKKDINGETVPYENNICENIQDSKFQQQLFKTYLDEKGIKDYNFDQILEIDDQINANINYELYEQHKSYSIKWIKWSNFMSYGKDNYFDFTSLKGLTLLTSEPANQGGKTTFCLDLLRFLLFGKVTSRESDWTLAKVFNKHLPKETEVVVEGCISIDGNDYIVKRTITRPAYEKRTAKSKVTQKVNYYKLVNDEYIDLYDEDCQEEVTGRETNKSIKEAIGNERDFDLMICVDSDNLKGLISLKDADRGRLISRWIGLLLLEEKDKIAREKFNHEVMPSLMMNKYDKEDLNNEVEQLQELIKQSTELIEKDTKLRDESTKKIEEYTKTKETLLSSKKEIDQNLLNVDVVTIETALNKTLEDGKIKRAELANNQEKLKQLGDVNFSEDEYNTLRGEEKRLSLELADSRVNYNRLVSEIDGLKKGEYCPTCGAKLKNVDNSARIAAKEKELEEIIQKGKETKAKSEENAKKIAELEENRKKYSEKCTLQLIIDKNEVDIENMLAKYRELQRTLKDIQDNKAAIENNNKIETSLNIVNENIKQETNYNNRLMEEITTNNASIETNNKAIEQRKKIISIIEGEEGTVKSWKIYLELIGKDGISKIVLRTVLPLINGELKHLLSDVCDFDVEVSIDDHNDVAFYLIHDGVYSNLASGSGFEQTVSSLALRSVLSKISSFSKPSFVVFDEILGGVAEENYDQVKKLYDKIVLDYQTILQITHLKSVSEWHSKTIVVEKKNNISTIKSC